MDFIGWQWNCKTTNVKINDEEEIFIKIPDNLLIKNYDDSINSIINETYPEFINRYCDYLYVLKDGRIINCGPPETVVTSAMLADVFDVKAHIITSEAGKPYIIYENSIIR